MRPLPCSDDREVVVTWLVAIALPIKPHDQFRLNCVAEEIGAAAHCPPSCSAIRSSAAPSGPLARPRASRQSARLITSMSAPCWSAKLHAIALSRAFTSALEFDL